MNSPIVIDDSDDSDEQPRRIRRKANETRRNELTSQCHKSWNGGYLDSESETKTQNERETDTDYDTEYHTEYDTEYDPQYDTESVGDDLSQSDQPQEDSLSLSSSSPDADQENIDSDSSEVEVDIAVHKPRHTRLKTRCSHGSIFDSEEGEDDYANFAHNAQMLVPEKERELLYPPQVLLHTNLLPSPGTLPEHQILRNFITSETHDSTNFKDEEKDQNYYSEFDLDDFYVYRSPDHPKGYRGEYESIDIVTSNLGLGHWLVDGTIKNGTLQQHFLKGEIVEVSIQGFEDTKSYSTEKSIFIQTKESRKRDYWYRFCSPTKAYTRLWRDFVWLADFTKFFIDYLHHCTSLGIPVKLSNFNLEFWKWLQDLHGEKIRGWHNMCGDRTDFREDVIQYTQFLYNQAYSLYAKEGDSEHSNLLHPIWTEIHAGGVSNGKQNTDQKKTTVSQNVTTSFSAFKHWAVFRLLKTIPFSKQVEKERDQRRARGNFPNKFQYDQSSHFQRNQEKKKLSKAEWLLEEAEVMDQNITIPRLGDLIEKVIIVRISSASGGNTYRYAWVTRAATRSRVSVIWLVLPSEFSGSKAIYPIGNELLFSDQCNCEPISVQDIVMILNASVFTDHAEYGCDLFIRARYLEEDGVIVNASSLSDLRCSCEVTQHLKKQPLLRNVRDRRKLRCLSLFSGCGLFDYAFCSPGYAEVDMAVEQWLIATLSYRANDKKHHTQCENQSVNDVFRKIAQGEVPMKHIDCIICGPPCQGFSKLNSHRKGFKGERNCSLLANTLSWVELLLPQYFLLENVSAMDYNDPKDPDCPNACRQAICFLVALGYQVRVSRKRDNELGGASIRDRLFIVAAAPSAVLPNDLVPTHGKEGSGLLRERTVRAAISDLDPIHNDAVLNIAKPRHVPLKRLKINWRKRENNRERVDNRELVNFRDLVKRIPKRPLQMSLMKAYHAGLLKSNERNYVETLKPYRREPNSKILMRIHPDRPFKTICTKVNPVDAQFGGQCVHPDQDRIITLEEARRAQSVPPWFLLVGSVEDQYKQLGNAVPWMMGASWGRSFGKAWLETLERNPQWGEGHAGQEEPTTDQAAAVVPQWRLHRRIEVVIPRERRPVVEGTAYTASVADRESPRDPQRKRARPVEATAGSESDDSVVFVMEQPVKKVRRSGSSQ